MFANTVRRHVTISRFFNAVRDERLPSVLVGGPFRRLRTQRPVFQRYFTSTMEGSQGVTIRRGRMEDVPGVWQLAEEAMWNTHQDMIETHFKMCENGWTIAEKDGNVVGGQLLRNIAEEYGERNIHFSSISYMIDTYERYNGAPLSRGDTGGKYFGVFRDIPLPPDASRTYHLSDLQQVELSALIDYDTSYHVVARPEMLKLWLDQTTAESLVLLEKGKIAGYGSIRPAMNGFYLGPLYAENTIGTMVLFRGLINLIPRDSNVDFFLPHANEAGQLILKANENTVGLYATFHRCARKSYIPVPKWNNVFALLSNECGLC
ncbi:uncharacterized protein LOC106177653 isoform X2 [Lingula anatina]|uniref:Uncharacterized protein LOC106177653 isoform X2 n=1 Tax=Lingula anatina TaxID=7574 RepID=A0A1S3K0Z1_LINAN|nr:uncharacterized protein LOC106177653 isoform X2 [Lingula anatina]|eukprot:XP_013415946.1 uncharacterized protein LOC106177653 isoform X2 [Lingula anatina]